MPETGAPKPFRWIGGDRALDFTNTVDWEDGQPADEELFRTYPILVEWFTEASVIDTAEREDLLATATRHPRAAAAALERVREIRQILHDIFFAFATGGTPGPERVRAFNRLLAEAPAQVGPADGAPAMIWRWPSDRSLLRPAWPVVWSAALLLTSPQLAQVGTCANDRCGWLFIDTSRRHNRKWCEMGVCGNRAKARRFQERQRRGTAGRT